VLKERRKSLDLPPGPVNKLEFCAFYRCSPRFVEGEVSKGKLRARKCDRKVFFLPSDIQAWLDGMATTEVPNPQKEKAAQYKVGRRGASAGDPDG
jgi:hypothetical protein